MRKFFEVYTRVGLTLLAPFFFYVLVFVGAAGHNAGSDMGVIVVALYSIFLSYLLTIVVRQQKRRLGMLFLVLMLPVYYFLIVSLYAVLIDRSTYLLIKGIIILAVIIYCVASVYTILKNIKRVE